MNDQPLRRIAGTGKTGVHVLLLLLLSTLLSQSQSLSSSPTPSTTTSTGSSTSNRNSNHIHTLLLCRHGDSIWNGGTPGSQETFTGWTDVPLSSKGITEAMNTATQLSRHFSDPGAGAGDGDGDHETNANANTNAMRIDVCLTSKLQRAKQTAHHCLWAFAEQHHNHNHKDEPLYKEDYRLNERHYGALQGYIKSHIESGKYGHSPQDVQAWRRSWYAVPPLLDDDDDRRIEELRAWMGHCGGDGDGDGDSDGSTKGDNVPRGESLEMVAEGRIRPFLEEVLHPLMTQAAERRDAGNAGVNSNAGVNGNSNVGGGCALIVAHANSLRALIGVICQVEKDEAALRRLEAMKIQTGVPLILKYRQLDNGTFEACNVEEAVMGGAGFGMNGNGNDAVNGVNGNGNHHNHHPSPDLPVWPLSSIPKTYATRSSSQQYHYSSINTRSNSNVETEKRLGRNKRTKMKKIRIDVI